MHDRQAWAPSSGAYEPAGHAIHAKAPPVVLITGGYCASHIMMHMSTSKQKLFITRSLSEAGSTTVQLTRQVFAHALLWPDASLIEAAKVPLLHLTHEDAPCPAAKVPGEQFMHVLMPSPPEYLPLSQSLHMVAPVLAEYLPDSHVVHASR